MKPSLKFKAKRALTPILAVITACLLILPLLAFFSYSNSPSTRTDRSVSIPGGILSDILLSIPSTNPAAIVVSLMMFVSCLFTYPIYAPPLNEILEETIRNKKTAGMFVADSRRLIYRLLQTAMISTIAWFCPFFGDIIFFDILEHDARWRDL